MRLTSPRAGIRRPSVRSGRPSAVSPMRPEGAAPFRISDSGAWDLNYWETPPAAQESLAPASAESDVLPGGGYWISPRG